jgi:predicted nucleic acid-binding protein
LSLVLDCSATLAFLLPDETTDQDLLDKIVATGAWVPSLWKLEVANGLSVAVRRRRTTTDIRNRMLEYLGGLDIRTDPQTGDAAWGATLVLADRYGLTLYDAAYLELSLRKNLPLATLDANLHKAAEASGVIVI